MSTTTASSRRGYEAGHTAGLRLLRVAARTRDTIGHEGVRTLYAALSARIFDSEPLPDSDRHEAAELDLRGTPAFLTPILTEAGLPLSLVEALDDDTLDLQIRAETEEALSLTGKDVGTPIIHVDPPHGAAFFGPVISRMPTDEDALELWDHVLGLARLPGFAELKRSLRELPQLRGLGVVDGEPGAVEDWHGGSRRTHK